MFCLFHPLHGPPPLRCLPLTLSLLFQFSAARPDPLPPNVVSCSAHTRLCYPRRGAGTSTAGKMTKVTDSPPLIQWERYGLLLACWVNSWAAASGFGAAVGGAGPGTAAEAPAGQPGTWRGGGLAAAGQQLGSAGACGGSSVPALRPQQWPGRRCGLEGGQLSWSCAGGWGWLGHRRAR